MRLPVISSVAVLALFLNACATSEPPSVVIALNPTAQQEIKELPFDPDDLMWLYKTTYGEVRQQGDTEVRAVCQVIYNRLQSGLWGTSFKDVVLAPRQFSVWNKRDKQRRYLLTDNMVDEVDYHRVVSICNEVLRERIFIGVDHSNGIDHFYHPASMQPKCVKYKKFGKRKRKFRNSHSFRIRCTRWRKLPPHWAYNYEYKARIGAGIFFTKRK